MLERSTTARFANHIWRLTDGHLSISKTGTTLGQASVPRGDSGSCRPKSQGRPLKKQSAGNKAPFQG